MFAHTARLLEASSRHLHEASCETLFERMRISVAFLAGYNALQAIQPAIPLDEHPAERVIRNGAAQIGLPEADLLLALSLRDWDDYGQYALEPSPAPLREVIAWATRVREAAARLVALS